MLTKSSVFVVPILMMSLLPLTTNASVFSDFISSAQAGTFDVGAPSKASNSQNMPLAMGLIGPSVMDSSNSASSDVTINDAALAPSIGPVGNESDVDNLPDSSGQISVYVTHKGDTLATVAKMFDVTRATIIAFNNLPANTTTLKEGTVLNILPISGVMYTVVKGDTLKTIAKKYKVEIGVLAVNNDISIDDDLIVGDTLLVPQSNEITPAKKTTGNTNTKTNGGKIPTFTQYGVDLGSFWLRPVAGGRLTQDLHGARHTGVDIAAPAGTPIMAAADGIVLVAMNYGYNTGYGQMIVINHKVGDRNIQTVYAHARKIYVTAGQVVSKGQMIAEVGRTGRATGTHLHFEINGAANPFHNNPNYGL